MDADYLLGIDVLGALSLGTPELQLDPSLSSGSTTAASNTTLEQPSSKSTNSPSLGTPQLTLDQQFATSPQQVKSEPKAKSSGGGGGMGGGIDYGAGIASVLNSTMDAVDSSQQQSSMNTAAASDRFAAEAARKKAISDAIAAVRAAKVKVDPAAQKRLDEAQRKLAALQKKSDAYDAKTGRTPKPEEKMASMTKYLAALGIIVGAGGGYYLYRRKAK